VAGEKERSDSFDGEWVKYDQGSDPQILFDAIHGKGTGWRTAGGIETATTHLEGGDFYVYYCYDSQGQPTIPEVAIRMQNGRVAEVRGSGPDQNLSEAELAEIAQTKYHDLPGGEKFDKKTADMKRLTSIYYKEFGFDKKTGEYFRKDQPEAFTPDELRFLYEVDGGIEGFGYKKDPRIEELLEGRDARQDLATALGCRPDQISFTKGEALSGDIVYHRGEFDFDWFTFAGGINLPQIINGDFYLGKRTSAEGINLPQIINGDLHLGRLTSAEGLNLPQTINGSLFLDGLTSDQGLNLPRLIKEALFLRGLTSLEYILGQPGLPEEIYLNQK
jgi:hypothetical protein